MFRQPYSLTGGETVGGRSGPLGGVLSQIRRARQDLADYPPSEFDWYQRSRESAKLLVPWLTSTAASLKTFVEEVLNARMSVRSV